MQRIKYILYILPIIIIIIAFQNIMKKEAVLVCYGKLKPETINGYRYVILESHHYLESNVRVFKSQNKQVFAYFSLGEVNENAPHYNALKEHTLGKNTIWNSHYLDLKNPVTRNIILEVTDSIFKKGFDGIFMDNFDNYTQFGPQNDQREGIITLLKELKAKYPNKLFLQNAGLELVPETHSYICGVAFESVASDYQFDTQIYQLRKETQYNERYASIKQMQSKWNVPVICIEYADTKNLKESIQKRMDSTDFDYFIGKIDLQTLPKF